MELSGQLHAPVALPPRRYPLDRRLGGPQSRSAHSGDEEKNSHTLLGLEHPIIQPIAQRYITELSRLCILFIYCLCKLSLLQ
jgi:hypothetical protein